MPQNQPQLQAQPRTKVALEDLAALVNFGEVKDKPVGGVTVVKAPPRPAPVDTTKQSPEVDPEVVRNFDWDQVNLDQTAIRLRDVMRNGVPAAIRYTYSDDVLALYGIDLNLLEGALRQPERVEIRPESFAKDKRYPVLGFYRGDIQVILGLRQPVTPKVIAAYATSRLDHDIHTVNHTGGGGNKGGTKRQPRTPRQLGHHSMVLPRPLLADADDDRRRLTGRAEQGDPSMADTQQLRLARLARGAVAPDAGSRCQPW